MDEGDHRASVEELRMLEEQSANTAASLAEARGAFGLGLQSVERKLHKLKKNFEGERGANDLAALWQQLRIAFDEADAQMATFKQAASAQEEQQREYFTKNGTYLNGLQSHMLGGERREEAGLASSIFKKCAFVADTLARNKHVAL